MFKLASATFHCVRVPNFPNYPVINITRHFAITGRHSKNVAHRKNKLDALKAKDKSRMGIKIIMAAKRGGLDVTSNVDLARALKEAHAMKIPKENIERALSKASHTDGENYSSGLYELYGHGGVGILVTTLTDSANRTIADIRLVAKNHEAKMAGPDSVAFLFNHKGYFQPTVGYSADLVLVAAIEDDLDEIDFALNENNDDDDEEPDTIITDSELVGPLQDIMHRLGIPGSSGLMYVPQDRVKVPLVAYDQNMALVEALEALEGVDTVFHNMDHDTHTFY